MVTRVDVFFINLSNFTNLTGLVEKTVSTYEVMSNDLIDEYYMHIRETVFSLGIKFVIQWNILF